MILNALGLAFIFGWFFALERCFINSDKMNQLRKPNNNNQTIWYDRLVKQQAY